MRRLLVLLVLFTLGAHAYADTIAMLPLDGEKRLEIYGQPVAAEIARALKAAGLDVVVVGAKMDVPDRANLIVDGTIKAAKNKQIEVSIRIRDPRDGTTLDTLPAPTTKLDDLDKTAAELAARVVPSVKSQLEALAKKAAVADKPINDTKVVQPPRPPTPAAPTLAVAVGFPASMRTPLPQLVALRTELDREAALWAATQHVEAKVKFEVLSYQQDRRKNVPMARARVRVVIEGGMAKFDRIVRTDTIVGDINAPPERLAARTAREVLAIVQPNLKRAFTEASSR